MKRRTGLSDAVLPPRCCLCDRLLPGPGTLCGDCLRYRLTPAAGGLCPVCGLKQKNCVCPDRPCFRTVSFPFFYEGPVKKALQRLKFQQRIDLVAPFGAELTAALRRIPEDERPTLVSFIPMRPFAEWRRGYNVSALLAEAVAKALDLPAEPLLRKEKGVRLQHRLPLQARRGNVLGAFTPPADAVARIAGRRILLVDDIFTTGSTLNEAAKTLLIFGAERVDCLCVAARARKSTENS